MDFAHLFEAAMLVCFGFSWPLNVRKAYKARSAKGTSLAFIILIITGYLAGIAAKFIHGQYNYVLAVYFLNLLIVLTNLAVYFRNKALDKKAASSNQLKVTAKDIEERVSKAKPLVRISSEENLDYISKVYEEKNAVMLIGGSMDKHIPVSELSNEFDFTFALYNKSQEKLSLKDAKKYMTSEILPLEPEACIFHLGDEDLNLFKTNPELFDNYYLELINEVKRYNSKERIALVSVNNPQNDKNIKSMNAHIKAISEAEKCTFVNLENAKLWNPDATKAANDFAYSMGLSQRKPLKNVSEILYSYAYKELLPTVKDAKIVG
ncbi:MAG: hypothetical protein K6F15_00665 [Treponema sp.]|nr:hypothetical protein [Treponema sp.]